MALFDRQERITLGMILCIVFLFVFSLLYAQNIYHPGISQKLPLNQIGNSVGVDSLDAKAYRIFAVAGKVELQPAQVFIPAGSAVDFYLTSTHANHTFRITHKNINLTASLGAVNKTSVQFEEAGTYTIVCTDDNNAHTNMQATIVVYRPATAFQYRQQQYPTRLYAAK